MTAPLLGQGRAEVRVVDAESGEQVACRLRLTDAAGHEVVPLGHAPSVAEEAQEGDVSFQAHRYCYTNGAFAVDPARLPLRYRILKGYEYEMAEGELASPELARGPATIGLKRWSSLAARGWYSGDIHIHHIAPQSCHLEMDAEDLNVANILTSDFTTDQHLFEGRLNRHSRGNRLIYVNQEFRNHELGHLCLLNLKKLIEPVKSVQEHHHPLHLRVCDETHRQGGYVSWAHFPSWPGVESPVDVALDKLDGLEILSVLDPRELPIFMKHIVPEWEANDGLRLWYRYLNCGYRLAATAGTDKMTTFVTVGANRVYARLDGEFTYENWIAALRAGRTFITNSPILHFTVNGREPGAEIRVDAGGSATMEVEASSESQLPYERLEIVSNGVVVADASPSGHRHTARIRIEHPVNGSCWLAARVREELDPYRAKGIDFKTVHSARGTLLSDYYGTRRPETVFAHASPVYVLVDGRPIRNWDDARYYVRYVDSSIRWLEKEAKFARPADKKASIDAFLRARAVWEERARQARA